MNDYPTIDPTTDPTYQERLHAHNIRPEGVAHLIELGTRANVPIRHTMNAMKWANNRKRLIPMDSPLAQRVFLARTMGFPIPEELVSPEVSTVVEIQLPDPVSDLAYAVSLHEFGHFFGPWVDEIKATQWAYDHARYWTADMSYNARVSLASYMPYQVIPAAYEAFVATLAPK